jgi:hypothetical protein
MSRAFPDLPLVFSRATAVDSGWGRWAFDRAGLRDIVVEVESGWFADRMR